MKPGSHVTAQLLPTFRPPIRRWRWLLWTPSSLDLDTRCPNAAKAHLFIHIDHATITIEGQHETIQTHPESGRRDDLKVSSAQVVARQLLNERVCFAASVEMDM